MELQSEKYILHMEHQLLEAMKAGDADTLESLLHEGLLFLIPTGQVVTKAMDIKNIRTGNLSISALEASDHSIRMMQDNAVVTVKIKLEGTFENQPMGGTYQYLRTWKLFDGAWKVIGGGGIELPS